jgi:hypothetical protein
MMMPGHGLETPHPSHLFKAGRFRNSLAVFNHSLDMKCQCLFGPRAGFVQRLAAGNGARGVGKGHAEIAVGFLVDQADVVAHDVT